MLLPKMASDLLDNDNALAPWHAHKVNREETHKLAFSDSQTGRLYQLQNQG